MIFKVLSFYGEVCPPYFFHPQLSAMHFKKCLICWKILLNLNANLYQRDFEQSLLSLDQSPAEIRLGLGENGSPKDLERLGFDTSLYIRGSLPEDFLVFSEGDAPFALSSSYTVKDVDPISILRQQR